MNQEHAEMKTEFDAYLEKIREAKKRSTEILRAWNPNRARAEEVLQYLWEALFDLLCGSEEMDLETLGKVTGYFQKLASSAQDLQSLEHHLQVEQVLKSDPEAVKMLSSETLATIEKALKLL